MRKKNGPEAAYFRNLELKKKKALSTEKKLKEERMLARQLKDLHEKHCAECGYVMEETTFRKKTILQCPMCNGVFLPVTTLKELFGEEKDFLESIFGVFRTHNKGKK
ncbi:MAG: zf-TFIIB domain-containing protein [Pseudomonadota bacterium]